MSNFEISVQFFLQIAVILGVCRLVGMAGRWFGQPMVVGEMVAGVLLGPSLLGMLAPDAQAWLFPPATRPVIFTVAQVGIALYMFLVGLEFRPELLRARARSAAAVSLAGIIVPFGLGAMLAVWLFKEQTLFTPGVTLMQAVLFMGAAMSITAFPMLARIIYERGLTGTTLGTLVLAAGSVDDALAWCVLAVVLASFGGDWLIALKAVGGGLLYVGFVLVVLRPILRRVLSTGGESVERPRVASGLSEIGERGEREERGEADTGERVARMGEGGAVTAGRLAFVLILLGLAAWYTDLIGIYAVFGAFFLGLAMPRGEFARDLRGKLGPLTTGLLLPMFFVYSGLNTKMTLLDSWAAWQLVGLVVGAACGGKFLACALAAKLSGEGTRDALAIGALMNARGLMELIILNIGLERGLITPTMFSVGVIMAIITTLMATPLFELVRGRSGAGLAGRRAGRVGVAAG